MIPVRPILVLLLLAGAAQAQSLWDPARPQPPLVGDTVARRVGDVLTILISERQTVRNEEESELTKDLSIDAELTDFDILENAFGILPSVAGSSNRGLEGEATYDKEGEFTTRIAVLVIDVMPNGNLLVEGRRRLAMDRETKTIRITGVVRPFDITTRNTVLSENVANAAIAYEGTGPLTRATNRGWASELLDFIWPF